jgi:cytochrome P450
MTPAAAAPAADRTLSLYRLLDPEVLANPYPLYHRLRTEDPVHWDPFLHAWVVTRYADVVTVLYKFSADRTPTPEQLAAMGLEALTPIARVMVKQMLFLDAPAHTRLRGLSAYAFTPRRVAVLREHIHDITRRLLDAAEARGGMDVIADLAAPLPAIVTAEMLGVPTEDHEQLKNWSADFAQVLGNFQHNPDHAARMLRATEGMAEYFRERIREQRRQPREGLINALLTAEVDGDRLSEEEVVANCMITMVGGQETTTNLIGNGLLALLRHPDELARLRADLALIPGAVEELLRFEPPSQHTARLAPDDVELGGTRIRKRQAVIAVMAAGNRDPERFPEPDRLDLRRADNRHLSFGWGAHFCFGAPLARIEGQVAFEALLRRFPRIELEPGPLVWRQNLGLRGLGRCPSRWGAAPSAARLPRASRRGRAARAAPGGAAAVVRAAAGLAARAARARPPALQRAGHHPLPGRARARRAGPRAHRPRRAPRGLAHRVPDRGRAPRAARPRRGRGGPAVRRPPTPPRHRARGGGPRGRRRGRAPALRRGARPARARAAGAPGRRRLAALPDAAPRDLRRLLALPDRGAGAGRALHGGPGGRARGPARAARAVRGLGGPAARGGRTRRP